MIEQLHILIVEDDRNASKMLEFLLAPIIENFPGSVISVRATFDEALEVIRQDPAPDIVTLDLALTRDMPTSTMEETLARLDEVESRCPFLIVTGYDPELVRRVAKRADLDIVQKRPEEMRTMNILRALVSAISRWQFRAHEARRTQLHNLITQLKALCAEEAQKI